MLFDVALTVLVGYSIFLSVTLVVRLVTGDHSKLL